MPQLKDVLSPALVGETRVATATPVLRRIFTDAMYDIFVGLYPGGLITTLVHYKREDLRIMSRLGEAPVIGSEKDAWVKAAVEAVRASGRGPFHLVRDAKLECQLTLSLHDRAALKLAGVEIPRSAGRFREMFLQASSDEK
jgi:hypothetical protein